MGHMPLTFSNLLQSAPFQLTKVPFVLVRVPLNACARHLYVALLTPFLNLYILLCGKRILLFSPLCCITYNGKAAKIHCAVESDVCVAMKNLSIKCGDLW